MTVREAYSVTCRGHLTTAMRFDDPIRIGLIDDCILYRAGVQQALSGIDDMELVGQGGTLGEILHEVYSQRPDIILLNVTAPRRDSSAIATCRSICPDAKVVVLAPSADDGEVRAALRAGASGYIPKSVTGSELVATLRSIAEDDVIVPIPLPATRDGDPAKLTPREEQVLSEVAHGRSNKDIARRLTISEKTVKQHITSMLQKLKVRNRVEAAMLGRKSQALD